MIQTETYLRQLLVPQDVPEALTGERTDFIRIGVAGGVFALVVKLLSANMVPTIFELVLTALTMYVFLSLLFKLTDRHNIIARRGILVGLGLSALPLLILLLIL